MFNNINNTISGLVGSVGPLPSLTGGYSGQLMSPNPNNGTISAADTYPVQNQVNTNPLPGDNAPYGNGTGIDGINPVAPTVPTPTGPVLSSTGPRQEFNSYQAKLDALLNQPDPFTPMYAQLQALNQTTQDNAIASATTASARQKFQEEQSGQQYQAGLATAGQQTGSSRYLPEYQLGLMESARNSTNDRIMQIDQAEKMAIAKAQQARIEGDVAVLKEQLNQVNELRKEKIRSLERAQDLEWDMKKFQQQMALDREKFSYQKAKDATDAKTAKKTPEQLSGFYTTARTILNTKGKDLSKADFEVIINEGLSYGEKREDILLQLASNLPDIKKKKLKNTYGITDVEYEKYFSK
jgi:hypothetical protein